MWAPAQEAPPPAPVAPQADPALVLSEEEANWKVRDSKLQESNTLAGSAGLLRMQYAQGAAAGQLRVGFMVDFFSGGFLCSPDFPCVSPTGGARVTTDSANHVGGTLSLGVGITDWLEAYAATSAYANSNDRGRPALLQVLGDSVLGVKGHFALSDIFHVGLFADLWLVNGLGSVGLAGPGTSFHLGPMFTADLRSKNIPLRFGTQASYTFDNTAKVVGDLETARGKAISRIERFGLGINRVDHFDLYLGAEAFFLDERIRPFAELEVNVPVNRQDYACRLNNESGDKCMKLEQLAPAKLTIGSRFFPMKRGLSLTAALDIGLAGTSNFVEEIRPTTPWTFFIGAGWAADTQERPSGQTKIVEKPVALKRAKIVGRVHEAGKAEGLQNAMIFWTSQPERTGLLSNGTGAFETPELDEGRYGFLVRADGYRDSNCDAQVGKGDVDVKVDCPLEALPKVGSVVGHVRDSATNDAIGNATVKLVDANRKELSLGSDGQGGFRAESLPGGKATFTVEADGYLSYVMSSDLKVRQENNVDLLLTKRPKNALVQVGKKEITIKQQIQFAVDSAQILPASNPLLNEIADAFVRTPGLRRVEVQGHTDNSGSADRNMLLSEQRSQAVADWLSSHGVASDRLVAKGYGQTKPLVPNVTTGNKAKNRRVQFIIVDQDVAPALPPVTKTKKAVAKPAAGAGF